MKCHATAILDRLIKKAATSLCHFHVAAIGLDYRGNVIIAKVNSPRFTRKGGGNHAEMVLMRSAPKSLRTIIIVRVNRRGELMPIDPCPACARKAAELGIQIRTLR